MHLMMYFLVTHGVVTWPASVAAKSLHSSEFFWSLYRQEDQTKSFPGVPSMSPSVLSSRWISSLLFAGNKWLLCDNTHRIEEHLCHWPKYNSLLWMLQKQTFYAFLSALQNNPWQIWRDYIYKGMMHVSFLYDCIEVGTISWQEKKLPLLGARRARCGFCVQPCEPLLKT